MSDLTDWTKDKFTKHIIKQNNQIIDLKTQLEKAEVVIRKINCIDEEMSHEDFIFIHNKLLMPAYQTLVPLNIRQAVKLTFEYASKRVMDCAKEYFKEKETKP